MKPKNSSKKLSGRLKPVFITGTPRSGTTLLYRTLLQHSSFTPKNLCLEETKVFQQPHLAIAGYQKPQPLYNYMLEDASAYQQFMNSIRFELFWQRLCEKFRLSLFVQNENTYWQLLLNTRVARKYFQHAKEARGCRRIVEKTPKHLLHAQRIFKSFPESKILITVRHPVDVFSSYKKRQQVSPGSKWLNVSVDEFIERYANMALLVASMVEKNMALSVKYEDFIAAPEQGFKKICGYIDEPFEREPVVQGEPRLNKWEADPYLSKPITAKTKKWFDYLNEHQASFIEGKLKKEMEIFGYSSRLS